MAKTTYRKTEGKPGGHLRPRVGQEPGRGGQDLHLRADRRDGSLLREQRG